MKITVLTPVRNGAETIKHCLETVNNQSINSEHLIIDGESSDGTVQILERYRDETGICFVSEPDRSVYDALNKGILAAEGSIIGVLHADDFYADEKVLEMVTNVFKDDAIESCYGDLEYVSIEDSTRVVRRWVSKPYDPKRFYMGWMPPHPTFFVRRRIYEKYGLYRLDMGTAADCELMLRLLFKHRISTIYIPKVLVKMRIGGMSNSSIGNRLAAHLMDRKAWKVNGLKPKPWTLLMKPLSKIGQFFPNISP